MLIVINEPCTRKSNHQMHDDDDDDDDDKNFVYNEHSLRGIGIFIFLKGLKTNPPSNILSSFFKNPSIFCF